MLLHTKRSLEIAQAIFDYRRPSDSTLFLAFDTSGAIGFSILKDYHRAIDLSIRRLDVEQTHVMQFDTTVGVTGTFKKGASCEHMQWRGGGGTMIKPVIEHVGRFSGGKSSRVLIFTDGYFSDLEVAAISAKWNVEPFLIILEEFSATVPEHFEGAII